MDQDFIQEMIVPILNSISVVSCLFLFYCYLFRAPIKTTGLKMIVIMGLSDFTYHITYFCSTYQPLPEDSELTTIFSVVVNHTSAFSLQFSLLWGCNMAFFLYRLICLEKISNPHTYIRNSVLLLCVLQILISVL